MVDYLLPEGMSRPGSARSRRITAKCPDGFEDFFIVAEVRDAARRDMGDFSAPFVLVIWFLCGFEPESNYEYVYAGLDHDHRAGDGTQAPGR